MQRLLDNVRLRKENHLRLVAAMDAFTPTFILPTKYAEYYKSDLA